MPPKPKPKAKAKATAHGSTKKKPFYEGLEEAGAGTLSLAGIKAVIRPLPYEPPKAHNGRLELDLDVKLDILESLILELRTAVEPGEDLRIQGFRRVFQYHDDPTTVPPYFPLSDLNEHGLGERDSSGEVAPMMPLADLAAARAKNEGPRFGVDKHSYNKSLAFFHPLRPLHPENKKGFVEFRLRLSVPASKRLPHHKVFFHSFSTDASVAQKIRHMESMEKNPAKFATYPQILCHATEKEVTRWSSARI